MIIDLFNPFTPKPARRFYSSMGNPLESMGYHSCPINELERANFTRLRYSYTVIEEQWYVFKNHDLHHKIYIFILVVTYLLLTEFEVRTVSYGPSFLPLIYGPNAKRAGHKSTRKNEKTRIRKLQYGPRKRG